MLVLQDRHAKACVKNKRLILWLRSNPSLTLGNDGSLNTTPDPFRAAALTSIGPTRTGRDGK